MPVRPKIKIELQKKDYLLEVVSIIVVVLCWVFAIKAYQSASSLVPVHFDASGNIDNYGKKSSLLISPIICTVLYLGLTLLSRFPHIFNYPVEITEQNANRQYIIAQKLLRALKLITVFVFLYIIFQKYRIINHSALKLSTLFIIGMIGVFVILTILYIVQSIKHKK